VHGKNEVGRGGGKEETRWEVGEGGRGEGREGLAYLYQVERAVL